MIFGQRSYIVCVPCEIVPAQVRHIASPFDGTIESAHVKPGDEVSEGQLLLRMDTRELIAKRDKLLGELEIAQLEMTQAAAAKDIAHAAAFLASDEAEFLTGVTLEVDGGRCI